MLLQIPQVLFLHINNKREEFMLKLQNHWSDRTFQTVVNYQIGKKKKSKNIFFERYSDLMNDD